MDLAVLSYHAWESDPDLVVKDVQSLRQRGWRHFSLEELESLLVRRDRRNGRFFHITSDDGSERDTDFVEALRSMNCPATLFVSLGTMSRASKRALGTLAGAADVRIEDHSLHHRKIFHYRQVVGFHCDSMPLVSSPERLGLLLGSPVCLSGPELLRPGFQPSADAVRICREVAQSTSAMPGTSAWISEITRHLLDSGLAFKRFGRLCIRGTYESARAFEARVDSYLAKGRRRVTEFGGREPVAFAFPWWQSSATAEHSLRRLGYRLTFSGLGLCRNRSPFRIPRLFVNNETLRPLVPKRMAARQRDPDRLRRLGAAAKRLALA